MGAISGEGRQAVLLGCMFDLKSFGTGAMFKKEQLRLGFSGKCFESEHAASTAYCDTPQGS